MPLPALARGSVGLCYLGSYYYSAALLACAFPLYAIASYPVKSGRLRLKACIIRLLRAALLKLRNQRIRLIILAPLHMPEHAVRYGGRRYHAIANKLHRLEQVVA